MRGRAAPRYTDEWRSGLLLLQPGRLLSSVALCCERMRGGSMRAKRRIPKREVEGERYLAREAGWSRWYRAACAVLFICSLVLLATGLIGLLTAGPGSAGLVTALDRSARYLSVVCSLTEGLLCLCASPVRTSF